MPNKTASLRWTNKPVKAAGWYWIKVGDGEPYINEFFASDIGKPHPFRNIRIAGPIPLPIESDGKTEDE